MAQIKTRWGTLNLTDAESNKIILGTTSLSNAPGTLIASLSLTNDTGQQKLITHTVNIQPLNQSVTLLSNKNISSTSAPLIQLVSVTHDSQVILGIPAETVFNNIPIATEKKIGGVLSVDIDPDNPNSLPLLNSIKVHHDASIAKDAKGTEVKVAAGWMEVNALDVAKLEQLDWLVLDSEDADGKFQQGE